MKALAGVEGLKGQGWEEDDLLKEHRPQGCVGLGVVQSWCGFLR